MAEPEVSGASGVSGAGGSPVRGGGAPGLLGGPPALVVAVESEAQWRWLAAIDFARAGVRPVHYRVAVPRASAPPAAAPPAGEVPAGEAPAGKAPASVLPASAPPVASPPPAGATRVLLPMRISAALPDFTAIVEGLAADRPVACFVAGSGPLARLVAVAADLAEVPVLHLVTTEAELESFGRRAKPMPDLYFLADEELLPPASLDPRYGATLLPTGHPAGDPAAGERIVDAIRDWRSGALPAAAPELSIVVPAYREEGNIELVCDRLLAMLEQDGLNAEILIVDDASPDDTYRVARAQMLRSPRIRVFSKPPPRGMGGGIRHGLRYARAPIVAVTMGDGSDEVSRIPEMYAKVHRENYGLAVGSRYRHRRNYRTVPPIYRFWSACFRLVARLLIGLRMSDYTNAFRVFHRRIFERYGAESNGFEISPEITFKAWFATRRVTEVDVCHLKRASGQSSFSFLRAGPGYALILLKALVNRLTGRWIVLEW
jgi:Glycosyl transferase family 2